MAQRNFVPLLLCGPLTLALCGYGVPGFSQESYKPLFSDAVLQAADPEARARLQGLNERNRQRWLESQSESGGSANSGIQPGAAASGKLYRVTDAQGNVRFSDQYVAGAQEVSVDSATPSAQSRAEHEARQREQARALEYFDDRNERRANELAATEQRRARVARHKAQCHDLLVEIQDNRRGGFVFYDVGADGERTYLSDAELSARTDKMEANYRQHCGELPPTPR